VHISDNLLPPSGQKKVLKYLKASKDASFIITRVLGAKVGVLMVTNDSDAIRHNETQIKTVSLGCWNRNSSCAQLQTSKGWQQSTTASLIPSSPLIVLKEQSLIDGTYKQQ
jgi:hypothetical protein